MRHGAASNYVGVRYRVGARDFVRGHVESYFLKANDPHEPRAVWIKVTIYAPRSSPHALAETWAVAFDAARGHVAVKSMIPFERARFSATELDIEVDGVTLRPTETRGAVESGGRSIAWNLCMTGDGLPLVHFPAAWMYEAKLPSTKLVSPFPDVRVTGDIDVNGERWSISGWRGMVGHNWGPRHTPHYAWGHCNTWELAPASASSSPDHANAVRARELVVEGLSARVATKPIGPIGPILSPTTTLLCIRDRGTRYELNSPIDLVMNRGEITPRRWTFKGQNAMVRAEGEIWAETDDFVGLFYANPDGTMTHCLSALLARARLDLQIEGGAPIALQSNAAALEIGTMNTDHGVRMYV